MKHPMSKVLLLIAQAAARSMTQEELENATAALLEIPSEDRVREGGGVPADLLMIFGEELSRR